MPPLGFEPTISAGEQLKTYALDRAATGTGTNILVLKVILNSTLPVMYTSLLHTIQTNFLQGICPMSNNGYVAYK